MAGGRFNCLVRRFSTFVTETYFFNRFLFSGSFVVHDRKLFVEEIMPTFFRMTKYESFQRQLNIYGFNRITAGRDRGGTNVNSCRDHHN